MTEEQAWQEIMNIPQLRLLAVGFLPSKGPCWLEIDSKVCGSNIQKKGLQFASENWPRDFWGTP